MKVYLATSGDYSAYSIHQVFKNKEDAAAYIAGMYDGAVEEYELRESLVKKRLHWRLEWNSEEFRFDRSDDGRQIRSSVTPEPTVWSRNEDDIDGPIKITVSWEHQAPFGGWDVLYINGPSEEAVLKVFSEQRAQYVARKEGIS